MGCCNGKQTPVKPKPGVPAPEKPRVEEKKLLLLGAGGSGKSTVFKQLKTLYGGGYSLKEREHLRWTIYTNVISSMKTLCRESDRYSPVSEQNIPSKNFMRTVSDESPLTPEIRQHLKALWADEGIRATYEMRSHFQLPTDIIHYFFNKIDEVGREGYIPSQEDIICCRVTSTGVQEAIFEVEGVKFRLLDVGGQRAERRTWAKVFEGVKCVLYVAAVSEYDQLLYEDNETNRVVEALDVFSDIVNSDIFDKTPVILMLNKIDILREKLLKAPLSQYFPDYGGDNSYDSVLAWMRAQFEQRVDHETRSAPIFVHYTCATRTEYVGKAFNEHVKDIVLSRNVEHMNGSVNDRSSASTQGGKAGLE